MNIIKHGKRPPPKTPETYIGTCTYCGCVFEAELKDLSYTSKDLKEAKCPEMLDGIPCNCKVTVIPKKTLDNKQRAEKACQSIHCGCGGKLRAIAGNSNQFITVCEKCGHSQDWCFDSIPEITVLAADERFCDEMEYHKSRTRE